MDLLIGGQVVEVVVLVVPEEMLLMSLVQEQTGQADQIQFLDHLLPMLRVEQVLRPLEVEEAQQGQPIPELVEQQETVARMLVVLVEAE